MDIDQWLSGLGLSQYAQGFADNDIDAATLGALTDDDLRELGVKSLGHRKKLLTAIEALRSNDGEAGPSEPAPAPDSPIVAEGERRQVTILFADLTDYTRMSAALDAEELHTLMDRVFTEIDGIVQNYGGSVDKHIGDEVMALFGAPVAHGDDPLRAVRAAIDIHRAIDRLGRETGRPLIFHVGIASGSVVAGGVGDSGRDEYTVLGSSVNLAARLNAAAQPGETLISEAVYDAVIGIVDCEPLGEIEVKGFDRPISTFRVQSLMEASRRSDTSPFVGRRNELRQFTAAIETCTETGAGNTIVLRADAGMGKTRLSEEFATIARTDGFAVHRGLVFDFGVSKEQDVIRWLIRSLLEVPAGSDDAARRACIEQAIADGRADEASRPFLFDFLSVELPLEDAAAFEAMDNAVRTSGKHDTFADLVRRISQRRPVMIVVEDIHWAEDVILGYLAALAIAVADCPAVLLMTTRIDGDPLTPAWRTSIRGNPILTIDLGPLRRDEVAEMAKRFLAANHELSLASIERAEGNPLFIEQLLRNAEERGGDELPASIQSLVLSRMDRLAAADKRALQAASVIGQRFDPEVVRYLIADEDYTCHSLIDHHLIRPDGDEFLFAHALIQEGVYSSLLNATKRQLHLRAAEWFAGEDRALQAEHLDRAGDAAAAATYLAAAREQGARYHFDTALRLCRRGLEIATEMTDVTALTTCLGDLLYATGEIAESAEAFEKVLASAQTDAERIPGWIGFAEAMRVVDRIDEGLAALDKAEAAASTLNRRLDLAHIHHLRGNLVFPSGDFETCRIEHQKALDEARAAGSVEFEARALGGLGDAAYASGHMLTAHDYFERCIDLAHKNGFGSIEVAYLFMRGDTVMFMGRIADSLADARQTISMAARVGNYRTEAFAGWVEVSAAFCVADIDTDRLTTTLDRMEELIDRLGLQRVVPLRYVGLGLLAFKRSDFAAVDVNLEKAFEAAKQTGVSFAGPWILGIWAMWTRDPKRRKWALAEGEKFLAERPAVSHNYIFFYQLAIEIGVEEGNWSEVERFAGLLERYMAPEPTPLTDLIVARGRVLARHARGEGGPEIAGELKALRDRADEFGYDLALPALDAALAGDADPKRQPG